MINYTFHKCHLERNEVKPKDLVFGLIERKQEAMLKQEEKVLIRTALMEYRYLLFKTYHGLDDEKTRIAQVNKLLQSWKV